MACYHPLSAYRCSDGSVVFHEKARFKIVAIMSLPCGQCIGCRLERSRQWAMRCMHEASLYDQNAFLTLTYAPDKIPPNNSLRYRDYQLFMKKLIKRYERPIRFFMCGEYGTHTVRPHYHALLFNFDFPDKVYHSKTSQGELLFSSKSLDKIWGLGHCMIGAVTFESAAYVARYCVSKRTGHGAADYYSSLDLETGEIISRVPEFAHMSLKPGIGRPWLDKFGSDVYPHDYVIVRGVKVKPPKYYDDLYERENPDELDFIKAQREFDAALNAADNTWERLAVKEKVHLARSSSLIRPLE
jgi:hypothetical protein